MAPDYFPGFCSILIFATGNAAIENKRTAQLAIAVSWPGQSASLLPRQQRANPLRIWHPWTVRPASRY
jgi:hypothetical protein